MNCQHCGKALPEGAHRFCPWCGKEQTFIPADAQQQMSHAAAEAKKMATTVAEEVGRALNDPRLRGAIPGRSLSIAGLAVMGAAILLSVIPLKWFPGVGLGWSIIMLLGGTLVAAIELRNTGVRVSGFEQIPANLMHPLLPPVFAGLVAVHAFLEFSLRITPILWVGAAVLLVYDQLQKAKQAPDSFGRYFDLRLAWYGYRKYILVGAALCLLSLFFTWSSQSSRWAGGFTSRYSSYYGGYVSDWDYLKYYYPGWELSGRAMGLSFFAVTALLSLVGWSAYRGNGTVPGWFNHLGAGLAGIAALFLLVNFEVKFGELIFVLGLGLIGLAISMIYQGKHTGEYDLDHLMGKVRK